MHQQQTWDDERQSNDECARAKSGPRGQQHGLEHPSADYDRIQPIRKVIVGEDPKNEGIKEYEPKQSRGQYPFRPKLRQTST